MITRNPFTWTHYTMLQQRRAYWNFIPQISGNFPRNYSGKVPLFFRKNSGKIPRKFPEISELTTLIMAFHTTRDASRHVARLRRLWATKNFRGNRLVTGHRTQLTIAVTDSAPLLWKWGTVQPYKTMLRAERAEKFWVCTPNCDILGLHSRKWSQKISMNLGARRQFGAPVPLDMWHVYPLCHV